MQVKIETTQGSIWYMRKHTIYVSFDCKWMEPASLFLIGYTDIIFNLRRSLAI